MFADDNAFSFNCVTVDGDTSTNDMLVVFANGAAGGPALVPGDGLEAFESALADVSLQLSRMIARLLSGRLWADEMMPLGEISRW